LVLCYAAPGAGRTIFLLVFWVRFVFFPTAVKQAETEPATTSIAAV